MKKYNIEYSSFHILFFNWAWQQGIMGYVFETVVMETCLKGDNLQQET